jgi:predicted permease
VSAVLLALAPVFLLILLGTALARGGAVPEAFWPPAERLIYYVCFPALLVSNIAKAELGELAVAPMTAANAAAVLMMAGLVMALRPLAEDLLGIDRPAFTSIFQGTIRFNTYVGLAVAHGLYGAPGLTLLAVCVTFMVPLVNLLSVAVLVRYVGGGRGGWRDVIGPVVRNPLILACVAGFLMNVSGLGLPPVIGPVLEVLGRAALPLGLLAVGAGLDLGAARQAGPAVAAATGLKLVVLPALAWLAATGFGVEGITAAAVVLFAGLPCAPAAYVLARQMGGDGPLMAGIITVTVLAAMVTLPALLCLLR